MHARAFAVPVMASGWVSACGDSRATSPTTADGPGASVEIRLTGRVPATAPGATLRLRMLDAPVWLYPVCPEGPAAVACGPEGPGVSLEAVVDGQPRVSFDVFTTGRTTRRVHGYEVTLLSVEPTSPLRRGEIDQAIARVRVVRSASAVQ